MLRGNIVGGSVVLSDDGKPIVETEAPTPPDGYEMKAVWRDDGTRIVQQWEAVPIAGTVDDAVRVLASMAAEKLDDDDALKVPALYGEWTPGQEYVGPNDPQGRPQSRKTWNGDLYRCLQTHTALAEWEPDDAPSLWAKILPGQDGSQDAGGSTSTGLLHPEWVQPDSTNPYAKGNKVAHNGHYWESTSDGNVWEPGAVGAPWNDLGEIGGQ